MSFEDRILELLEDPAHFEDRLLGLAEQPGFAWPVRAFFSPERQGLLGLLPCDLGGWSILEVGAGLGTLSEELIRRGGSLSVCEPDRSRARILAKRFGGRISLFEGRLEDLAGEAGTKDLVFVCGVLEYAAAEGEGGAARFLDRCRSLLKPEGGTLLLAIENRFGAKYLMGAGEDHTALPGDGISGYAGIDRVRTYSPGELTSLLESVGFRVDDWYGAFPDYKTATIIASPDAVAGGVPGRQCLAGFIDPGLSLLPGTPFLKILDPGPFMELLIDSGAAIHFANSLVFRCSPAGGRPTEGRYPLAVLDRSRLRRRRFQKSVRIFADRVETYQVIARPESRGGDAPDGFPFRILEPPETLAFLSANSVPRVAIASHAVRGEHFEIVREKVGEQELFVNVAAGTAARGDWGRLRSLLEAYRRAASTLLGEDANGTVIGVIDFVPRNLVLRSGRAGDEFLIFDFEFVSPDRIPVGYLLFRAAASLGEDLGLFLRGGLLEKARRLVRETLLPGGDDEGLARMAGLEARFQAFVHDGTTAAMRRSQAIRQGASEAEWAGRFAPSLPELLGRHSELQRRLEELLLERTRLKYRAADRIDAFLGRIPAARKAVRWILLNGWALARRGAG